MEMPHDWRTGAITAAELQNKIFPPIKWAIEPLIAEGLTILAGRPKVGKSWWILDGALAVAGGAFAFGEYRANTGDVLYLALEDNERRLKDRISRLVPSMFGQKAQWPERLT